MPEHVDEHPENTPGCHEEDLLSIQRAALREFLALSSDSVRPTELRVEQWHGKAEKAAQAELDAATDRVGTRLRVQKDLIEREYDEQVSRIEGVYTSDCTILDANTGTARQRILSEAKDIATEARKELDNTVWMAETVAGVTVKGLHEALRKAEKKALDDRDRLASQREYAENLLQEYEQPVPPRFASDVGEQEPLSDDDPAEAFEQQSALISERLDALARLILPRLFVGTRRYVLAGFLCAAAVGGAGALSLLRVPHVPYFFITGPLAAACVLGVVWPVGRVLRRKAARSIQAAFGPLVQTLEAARLTLDRRLELAKRQIKADETAAIEKRNGEIREAKATYEAEMAQVGLRRTSSLSQLDEARAKLREEIDGRRDAGLGQAEESRAARNAELQEEHDRGLETARNEYKQRKDACCRRYDVARAALRRRWERGVSCLERLVEATDRVNRRTLLDWHEGAWSDWGPPEEPTSTIPFGCWCVDLTGLSAGVREQMSFAQDRSAILSTPALLTLPHRGSLLLQTSRTGREDAIQTLRAVMLRLLTSFPPGRVQFTIIDPVGLGENFAGFMHLADHAGALVGDRIWTDSTHIEQRLTDLTEHMETVIQKYLRNEFETIDAYNEQAGELAEPYRFLVIADFPANFTEGAAARLSSIISSGARCGVYTLIAHDQRPDLPPGIQLEDLQACGIRLVHDGEQFVWEDELLRQFPLTLDAPPEDEQTLTHIMHAVGRGAKESLRIEVPFETIAPSDAECWTGSTNRDIEVRIGRAGAVRLQPLRLGQGVAQHALIAGKTGSGKSTLLHVIITNLALWYGPEEVEFYLVDFKKGVEFKTYVTHTLPHARAVAIESDREFGLSVLQRIDAEMSRRGDLFRREQVQDLAAYREASGTTLPRTLLIVDEFQVFFSEDDKLSQDASILLDRLVRQGRAFGIHVLLGSQTLGGTAGLARSTMGQMAVRIALQCSEADSQLILDDANLAARLLSRPGEAIYNDAGGLVEGNNPFQTAWLSDEQRDVYLDRVKDLDHGRSGERDPLIVFEGNAPADIRKNRGLVRLIEASECPPAPTAPRAWFGEPVAIKDPTAVAMRRQAGANVLFVGQRDEAATAMMASAMLSLSAQHAPGGARFVIFDGSPADSPLAGRLEHVGTMLPHAVRVVAWREVDDAMAELERDVQQRLEADQPDAPAVYVFIYGLQRYRMLRRSDDDFSFSVDEEDKPPDPAKLFSDVLRDGAPVGIHTLIWADTLATVERTLDRQALREFDHRVLFQMSANDSANLIDSAAATKLGFHRALLYSEEHGLVEKFRPYAFPEAGWLEETKQRLASRTT